MALERKIKVALNDNRLLILGAQVLFGFQFNGTFQELFAGLPFSSRALACSGLLLLMLTVGLLITPSMHHRIVERGEDSARILTLTTAFSGWALLPLAIAMGFDIFITLARVQGATAGALIAGAFFLIAMACWYALEIFMRKKSRPMTKAVKPTPIADKVEQLLTEARVIIPGAQALFGFQLSVTLMQSFDQLSPEMKAAHVIAICCIGLAIILVIAPASLHRLAFAGEDDPAFLKIGSLFVLAAPAPLAIGIAFDAYVAAGRAIHSQTVATVLGAVAMIALLGLWYAYPLWWRLAYGTARE